MNKDAFAISKIPFGLSTVKASKNCMQQRRVCKATLDPLKFSKILLMILVSCGILSDPGIVFVS